MNKNKAQEDANQLLSNLDINEEHELLNRSKTLFTTILETSLLKEEEKIYIIDQIKDMALDEKIWLTHFLDGAEAVYPELANREKYARYWQGTKANAMGLFLYCLALALMISTVVVIIAVSIAGGGLWGLPVALCIGLCAVGCLGQAGKNCVNAEKLFDTNGEKNIQDQRVKETDAFLTPMLTMFGVFPAQTSDSDNQFSLWLDPSRKNFSEESNGLK
jgi:hypothetical protein